VLKNHATKTIGEVEKPHALMLPLYGLEKSPGTQDEKHEKR
jgi:hypothetical protein